MKKAFALICCAIVIPAASLPAAQTTPAIIEKGPHHRVIERTVSEVQPDGTRRERQSSYVELATGLHYEKDGEWVESREEIEIFQGAAIARQGQMQVVFEANLNSPGAIDLLDPAGGRFRSHVLGLIYTDYASGHSVMIAEIKDSIGQVLPPNQVVYADAFDGDCVADVRYTITKSGFEQDVILRTAPPSPAEWGLNPETTRLEVFTEFIEMPEAQVTSVVLKQEHDAVARQFMKEPDLIDQQLDFVGLRIGPGQAFPLDASTDPFSETTTPTGKSLERIDGRLILIEKVDYPSVRAQLGQLPPSAALNKARKVALPDPGRTMLASLLPSRPAATSARWREGQYAKADTSRKGFVLDYVAVAASSLTNYHFKGDTTYHVTGLVQLYGTTVLEGAVIKYDSSASYLQIRGPVDCRTSSYRPAIFTAKDDDTVGEIIAGSTGVPTNYYGSSQMLDLRDTTLTYDLHHLHFFHPYRAITLVANGKADLRHLQVGPGRYALGQNSGSIVTCRNFLFHDLADHGTITSGIPTNRSEHGTLHRVENFRSNTNGLFTLTNSLLISVTNNLFFVGANNVTNLSDTGIFQTVGAATHYLAAGSVHRDAGTTNINPTLLAELRQRTTYPPVVLTDAITNDTTLAPQASRDTDLPDLGYHHDPLDYAGSQLTITNATLTLSAGTALGLYGGSSAAGLLLLDGGKIVSEGTPDNLNRIVRYNLVQEKGTNAWSASSVGKSITTPGTYATNTYAGEVRLRFTEFSMPANGNDHLYTAATNLSYSVRDCQFHGGQVTSLRPDVTLLNNLFDRVLFKLYAPVNGFTALMRNGTHFGGSVTVSNVAGGSWNVRDNLFDSTNVVQNGTVTNNYNAYLTNGVRLTPNSANDVLLTLTNVAYEVGLLGRFYLPTNLTSHNPLFNAGSQNATNAGLYHYTMVTNQTRELTTTVDVGFHYVALNSSGQPHDTDGDGLADYLEDANGNGVADSGEKEWQNADSDGDGVSDFLEYLMGRNAAISGTTNDVGGTLNLRIYTPLK